MEDERTKVNTENMAEEESIDESLEEIRKQARARHRRTDSQESGSGWDNGSSYIDTTYLTQKRETDELKPGFASLMVGIVLSGFLFGFGLLYSILILSGRMAPAGDMGSAIPSAGFWIWAGLFIAALLLNVIAVCVKGPVISFLAFAFYVAATVIVLTVMGLSPLYIALTALQALVCLIAGLRKIFAKAE